MSSRMQRIVVIGSPGAGKTTFARRLGHHLHIEVTHLDRFFWGPKWKEKPREERIKIQRNLVHGGKWIIEGTYLDSSDERLHAADTVIFLDVPRLVCLQRAIKRRFKYRSKSRPDLPVGCREKLRFPYILKVLVFPERGRVLFLQKINEIENNLLQMENKTLCFWLKSDDDIEDFFEGKAVPHTAQPIDIANQQKLAILSKMNSAAAYILHWMRENRGRIGTSLALASLSPIALWCISDNKVDSDTIQ